MGTGNKKFRAGNLPIDFCSVIVFKTISLLLSTIFCCLAVNTGPSCDDLEAFVSYLIQLVHGCDLERVGLLLRHVQRYVIKRYMARTLIFMHHFPLSVLHNHRSIPVPIRHIISYHIISGISSAPITKRT